MIISALELMIAVREELEEKFFVTGSSLGVGKDIQFWVIPKNGMGEKESTEVISSLPSVGGGKISGINYSSGGIGCDVITVTLK